MIDTKHFMNIKYLFFISRHYHIPHLRPIWTWIQNHHNCEVGFFSTIIDSNYSTNEASPDGLKKEIIKTLNKHEIPYIKNPYQYSPDITFTTTNNYQWVEGLGKIVSIGHGTISKGLYFLSNKYSLRENLADLICVPGQIQKSRLEKILTTPIAITGMPKLDQLFHQSITTNLSKLDKGFHNSNKTLLIAPTFNPELSLVPILESLINKYLSNQFNIILKFHDYTPTSIKNKFQQISKTSSHIHFAKSENAADYFLISDILITDVSSIAYEFKALKKPVIFYDNPLQKLYSGYHPKNIEIQFRDIGLRFNQLNQFSKVLKQTLNLKPSIKKKHNHISEQFVSSFNGSSSKQVVHSALKTLKTKNNKPLIILHQMGRESLTPVLTRIGNQFNIVVVGTSLPQNLPKTLEILKGPYSPQQVIKIISQKFSKRRLFIYLNTQYEFSPNIFRIIENHFQLNPKLKILTPLLGNPINSSLQELRAFGCRLFHEIPFETLPTIYTNPFCVSFKNSKSNIDLLLHKLDWEKPHVLSDKFTLTLALDCLIFKNPSLKKWKFNFEKFNGKYSIFYNLLSLDKNYLPHNFHKNIFQKIKKNKINWNHQEKVIYFTDLGSAYCKAEQYSAAYRILSKAKPYLKNTPKETTGRVFF